MKQLDNSTQKPISQVPILYWYDHKPSHGYHAPMWYSLSDVEDRLYELAGKLTDGANPDYGLIERIQDVAYQILMLKGDLK